ncbi:nucleosidase [Streptomyces sp. NPDC047461]|uniref:5'-methylthioadenosine/S-adenosylhomocysteine nucleosidase family protein n=1 Tax=Streptomyces sp. NPDC047461 TaxID=3155619 RepID=UPI0033D827DF
MTQPHSADAPTRGSGPTTRTAVVITALGVESQAVVEHFTPGSRPLREADGTVYEIGTFHGDHGPWTVPLVEAGQGNTSAGIELDRAVRVFAPEVVLFVGIAGGVKDVALGDVVAADAVYDYERGKDTKDGFVPRIKTKSSSHRLLQYARTAARQKAWTARVRPAPASGPPPRSLVAPIAAGGKVVGHDRSRTAELLRAHCGDAVAVEMEGYGFLHGAYLNPQVGALVVRGVSDLLNDKGEENDRTEQPRAARHAAAFAFELLDVLRSAEPQR